MKLNLIERQVSQPGGSRGPLPANTKLAGAFGAELSALGREVGTMSADMAEREARAKRAALVTERVSQAHVDYDAWFTQRSLDPEANETLVKDSEKFQRELSTSLTDGLDPETSRQISGNLQPVFASQRIKARSTATQQGVALSNVRSEVGRNNLAAASFHAESREELRNITALGFASIEAQRHAGTISPQEAELTRQKFHSEVLVNSFQATMQKVGVIEAEAIARAYESEPDTSVSPEKWKQNAAAMRSLLSSYGSGEDRARKARYALGEREATLLFMQGRLSPEILERMVEKDYLDPGISRQLLSAAAKGGPVNDNPHALAEYKLDPMARSEREIATDSRLTMDTRLKLIDERRQREKDASDWRNTQSGKEAVRRIKGEFGLVDGLISQLDPEIAKRANYALTRLYETVEQLPLKERASKSIEISEQVIKTYVRADAERDLAMLRQRLQKLPYKSIAELEAAKARGAIRGHEAGVLKKQLESVLMQLDENQRKAEGRP